MAQSQLVASRAAASPAAPRSQQGRACACASVRCCHCRHRTRRRRRRRRLARRRPRSRVRAARPSRSASARAEGLAREQVEATEHGRVVDCRRLGLGIARVLVGQSLGAPAPHDVGRIRRVDVLALVALLNSQRPENKAQLHHGQRDPRHAPC
eukprot:7377295-Prymnesium_polylepis.2